MTESMPSRYEQQREKPDAEVAEAEGGEVIAFPGPAGTTTVTPVADADPDDPTVEVVTGEIVDDDLSGDVEPYDRHPEPVEIVAAYWRRARHAARPDRVALAVARHELYYGPKGLAHALPGAWRWITAAELDQHLASNPKMVLETRKMRKKVAAVGAVGAVGGTAAAWVLLSALAPLAILIVVLAVAGAAERTRSGASAIGDRNREGIGTDPSSKDLKHALSQVKGLGTAEEIRVLGPITRNAGDTAWIANVQMPVTFTKLRAKHEEIAGQFDVAASQLRLSPSKTSESRARLWCSDEDPLTGPPIMSPLIGRTEPFDIWREKIFLGTSVYGSTVDFTPINKAGMLTGGESGSGKSVADDEILCAVALDPHAELWLVDAKMVELEAYRCIAREYLGEPDREAFKAIIQRLTDEKDRRLREMAKAGVVRITADNWKRFNAPFILFHVDEIQMFIVGEKKGEVSDPLGKFVSQCRAVGIFVSLATQYPKADVVPTFIRVNLSLRMGLRCDGVTSSNVILGDGMAGRGYNAAAFTEDQKGAAWLKGEKGDPVQLRTGYLEKPDQGEKGDHHVRDIVKVAYELRKQAGTLPTGDDRPAVRLLEAMIAIIAESGQRNAHTSEHLLPGLAVRLPETAGWGPEDLVAALPEGTRTGASKNVRAVCADGEERPRPGYRLSDLQDALKRL